MKLTIFAAQHEETNNGWVWVAKPHIKSRTLAKLTNSDTTKSVFCESRVLDENFRNLYNDRPHTISIAKKDIESVIVMGDWYRKALGAGDPGSCVNLKITSLNGSDWAGIKAGCQHPDPIVRTATRLGVLSVWLGIGGLLLGVFLTVWPAKAFVGEMIVLALGLASLFVIKR